MNKTRRKEIDKAIALLQDIAHKWDEVREICQLEGEGEREYFDNMSDNLKGSERGEQADNAATQLEEVYNEIDTCDLAELITKLEEARE
jgi:hypothetical protein